MLFGTKETLVFHFFQTFEIKFTFYNKPFNDKQNNKPKFSVSSTPTSIRDMRVGQEKQLGLKRLKYKVPPQTMFIL